MRWERQVARLGNIRNAYKFLVGKMLKGRKHLEDLGWTGR